MEPLVFEPHLKSVVWGGRRLGTVLGKRLPTDALYGESWELSPHPFHVSRVSEGALAGRTLNDLCRDAASELYGEKSQPGPFPLLIKLLDCQQLLSIQVHPDDQLARQLAAEQFGKTEAWVVLESQPGALIYAGLKPGVQRPDVERLLAAGALEQAVHSFHPESGDVVFLPAGTIHAVGGGVLMAEVQQASDATFRLYDWNRPGADGRPRELHIEHALASINWGAGPVQPVIPQTGVSSSGTQLELCVDCPQFRMERVRLAPRTTLGVARELSVWMVLAGDAELHTATGSSRRFQRGETVLIPASTQDARWETGESPAMLLKVIPGLKTSGS